MEVPRVSPSNKGESTLIGRPAPLVPTWSDCYGIVQLFPAFASGFPLSQCFFLFGPWQRTVTSTVPWPSGASVRGNCPGAAAGHLPSGSQPSQPPARPGRSCTCLLKLAKEAECGGDQRAGAHKQMPPHTSCYYPHFLWPRI